MGAKEFLKNKLQVIFSKFDNIEIRYEYNKGTSVHVVEILPIDVFESHSYMDEEVALESEFEQLYPNEEVLFISSESLTEIKNPEYSFGAEGQI